MRAMYGCMSCMQPSNQGLELMLPSAYLMARVLTLVPQARSHRMAQLSLQFFDLCLVPQTPNLQDTV